MSDTNNIEAMEDGLLDEQYEEPKSSSNEANKASNAKPANIKAAPKSKGNGMSLKKKLLLGAGGVIVVIGIATAFTIMKPQEQAQEDQPIEEPIAKTESLSAVKPIVEPQNALVSSGVSDTSSSSAVVASSSVAVTQPINNTQAQPVVANGLDTRTTAAEARLDRIEEYLTKLDAQLSAQKQTKKKHYVQHKKAKVTPKIIASKDLGLQHRTELTSVPLEQEQAIPQPKPNQPKPKLVFCEYRGGLNNRAWISCDNVLKSVKRGDILPMPYGEVSSVNDQAGNITTVGGLIQ